MTYKKKPCIFTYYARIFRKKNMQTCETWLKRLGFGRLALGIQQTSQATSARSLAQGDATRRATVRAFDVHLWHSGRTAYAQVCHVFFFDGSDVVQT